MAMTLDPCPFCGGEPQVRMPTEHDGFAAHVMCRCGAQLYGHKRHLASEQEAIEAWNRRAHLTRPAQAVDVGAIQRVAEEASVLAAWETVQLSSAQLQCWADKLTRALSAEKAGCVPDDDVRWLLAQLRHNEFSHDYIKDEKACDMCKRIKRIASLLHASPTPDKEG